MFFCAACRKKFLSHIPQVLVSDRRISDYLSRLLQRRPISNTRYFVGNTAEHRGSAISLQLGSSQRADVSASIVEAIFSGDVRSVETETSAR